MHFLLLPLLLSPFSVGCNNNASEDPSGTDAGSGGSVSVSVRSELGTSVARTVLHEAFSGSNCGPCAPAADNISTALADQSSEYAMLKFQIGSDPYITREAVRRRMFYLPGEETYGIPWVVADGIHEFHPNDMDHGGVYTAEDFDALAALPAYLEVDVSMTVTGQTVDIAVELYPTVDIAGEDLRLMVAIKELTTFNNVGSNGQTEFHDVLKKFVPNDSGIELDTLIAGEVTTHDLQFVFQGSYDTEAGYSSQVDHTTAHTVEDFANLAVVAWVQDLDSWEVFNAGEAGGH
jgi:hypothetical protein